MVSHLTSPLCAAQTWTSTLSCRGYSSLWQHSDWQQQMRYTDLANFMYQSVFPSVMFSKKKIIKPPELLFLLMIWVFLSFQTKLANGTSSMIVPKQRKLSASYEKEKELCVKYFEQWSESDQVEFVEHLISQMCHYQHGHINSYLKPMLQRDFITALPGISAGRGSLLFHLVFQKTVPLGFLWLWPALLMRSLQGSACKIDDSFWMKSSIPMQNIGTFCFVFLPSL